LVLIGANSSFYITTQLIVEPQGATSTKGALYQSCFPSLWCEKLWLLGSENGIFGKLWKKIMKYFRYQIILSWLR